MFVRTQEGDKIIRLNNVTNVHFGRIIDNGKQKYILYFDNFSVGVFKKQEDVEKVLMMLERKIGESCNAQIVDGNGDEPSKIIYYTDRVFKFQVRMIWHEETIICKRQSI